MMKIVGNADVGEVETRYNGDDLDEIVASNAHIHLEMMGPECYSLIVETAKQRVFFSIFTKNARAHLVAVEQERDTINRRAEAARCRENRKKLARPEEPTRCSGSAKRAR